MCHFTATETKRYFHLDAATQELLHTAHFDLIIMLVNIRTKLDFFNLDNLLLFTRFISAFLRFIFIFAVIENLANWWINIGLHLNEIKAEIFGLTYCF